MNSNKSAPHQLSRSAHLLSQHLLSCGYGASNLVGNFHLDDRNLIDLVAFSHTPHDTRSACIAVVSDSGISSDNVRRCRNSGAPIVFSNWNDKWRFWRQGPLASQLVEEVSESSLASFFSDYRERISPDSIYRAKTQGRLDATYQLSFVDLGLMPLLEQEAGDRLSRLFVRLVTSTRDKLGWKDVSEKQGQWLLQSNFWLLAAKILRDKGVPGFDTLDFGDIPDVFARVSKHYAAGIPVPTGSILQIDALKESAYVVSEFSDLRVMSTEALAYLYENALVSKETRVMLGTHSTPTYLVDYIVGKLRPWIQEMPEKDRRFFEPACGHAAFLQAARRLLDDLLSEDAASLEGRHEYFQSRLVGCDIDTFAIELARLSLTMADAPNPNGWQLRTYDMFEGGETERLVRQANIILANPPFEKFTVSQFSNAKLNRENEAATSTNKAAEILTRVIGSMNAGAVFGFVLPQIILNGKNFTHLRKSLLRDFEIEEICSFPDKVFNFADSESAVIIGRKLQKGATGKTRVLYRNVRERDVERFKSSYEATFEVEVGKETFEANQDFVLICPKLQELWSYCSELPLLESVARIGKGLDFLSKKNDDFPTGSITYQPNFSEDLVPGFVKVNRNSVTHGLPPVFWLNMKKSVIKTVRLGASNGTSQVIMNYAPVSRSPWRLKAFIDRSGHPVTSSFVVIRPSQEHWTTEALWAICNSPLANAYAYDHSSKRNVGAAVLNRIPIPVASESDISFLHQEVLYYLSAAANSSPTVLKSLHTRLDALVLKLYNLPAALERQLLDVFNQFRRNGVPFIQEGYIPESFQEDIGLDDYLHLTDDWEGTNERRSALIDKDVRGRISSQEAIELQHLQTLADLRIRLFAPLPFDEIDSLETLMRQRGILPG